MFRGELTEKMFKQRLEGDERVAFVGIWGKSALVRGNCKGHGPKVDTCLVFQRHIKQTGVAGA